VKPLRLYLPALAALAFFGAAVGWMSRDARIPREAFRAYSIHNQGPEGLSLGAAYLAERGLAVGTLLRPLERSEVAREGVVLRIRPEVTALLGPHPSRRKGVEEGGPRSGPPSDPSPGPAKTAPPPAEAPPGDYLSAPEETWVREGGRMVLAIDHAYGSLRVRTGRAGTVLKVFPIWPPVEHVENPGTRILESPSLGPAYSVFLTEDGPLVARRRIGKGDVWLLACPEDFQNRTLGEADHLGFLGALAGGRPVYFDESVHGLRSEAGVTEILRQWGLGPFLILGAGALLVAFWRLHARVGPEEEDVSEGRVEAIDFVDSLAILYHRALPRRQAIALYRQAFDQSVAVRTGLRGAALETRIRELLGSRADPSGSRGRDLSGPEFQNQLREINVAFGRLEHAKRPGNRRATQGAGRPA
jgi:hypothetical protein